MTVIHEVSPEMVQRLTKEAREREARLRSWMLVADALAHIKPEDITLETNPLDLGGGGSSYLEQVRINFPEVQPGYGEIILKVLQTLPALVETIQRDMLSDPERIAIGWSDVPPVKRQAQ
jgi:hypothetical protein